MNPSDIFRLDGKIALVTGSSRGLGKQIASEFGRVDILINNAGVTQLTYTPTEELPVKTILTAKAQRTQRINFHFC